MESQALILICVVVVLGVILLVLLVAVAPLLSRNRRAPYPLRKPDR
jgi:NADH:ubiquinone oxidoreductase subunit 3 (subunit A)